jgi:Ca-activated chloride channel family protein
MSLNWPWALAALLAFPLLLGYRWWTRRRRRREALRMSSVSIIRAALPGRSLWRRRIPLWLFAAGLVVLGTGAARPQASVIVPSEAATVMLAIDVSASMCSTDVQPNRLTAAERAAKEFIEAQPDKSRIGLVAFSGIAGVQVEPTTDKKALENAIDQFRTGRGTAIGLGILSALDQIAQINPNVPPIGVDLPPPVAEAAGQYEPDIIVLLTDGANTQGVDPVTAAEQAQARHVRVYTIGFGTTDPSPLVCSPNQIGSGGNPFGRPFGSAGGFNGQGGGGGGFGRRAQDIDENTLQKVATTTGGKYFQAKDAQELSQVLRDLPSVLVLQHRKVELTVWFALAGALLVLLGVGLAQWWNRSIPTGPLRTDLLAAPAAPAPRIAMQP